jgi:hypothetical protein
VLIQTLVHCDTQNHRFLISLDNFFSHSPTKGMVDLGGGFVVHAEAKCCKFRGKIVRNKTAVEAVDVSWIYRKKKKKKKQKKKKKKKKNQKKKKKKKKNLDIEASDQSH